MKKKILTVLACTLVLVSLCSCNKDKTPNDTNKDGAEIKYENVTSTEHNEKFLHKSFDEDFVVAFVDEYFKAVKVRKSDSFEDAKFKSAVIGNSEEIAPAVARAVIEDTINSVIKEKPTYYRVEINKSETSVTVKIFYTLSDTVKETA